MLRLQSVGLLNAISYLSSANKHLAVLRRSMIDTQSVSCSFDAAAYMSIGICAGWLRKLAEMHHLVATKAAADRLEDAVKHSAWLHLNLTEDVLKPIIDYSGQLVTVVQDELNARLIFTMPLGHAEFYEPVEPLFGQLVDDAFSNASQEISDAGKCRALGQWTACVMHLMRALESPLTALAGHCGVSSGNNWNKELNEIEAQLRSVQKSSHGADGEQWASEAAAHLRNIKNAWRNHAQHGRARYNEEEAVAIWGNVRSFMRTLAVRLRE